MYPRITKVLATYGADSESFTCDCRRWLSDHYAWSGDFVAAIEHFPELTLGRVATHAANHLINMKRLVVCNVGAAVLMALIGPTLTPWSREFLPLVCKEFESALCQMQADRSVSLIEGWSRGENRYPWHLFLGLSSRVTVTLDKPFYCYYADKEIVAFVNSEVRDAENRRRVAAGVPKIGEGWVTETTLYYQIKEAFPGHEVVQHAQPPWLGRQHLDIFIPALSVAIEFQGKQHDEPIEYFGGREQFEMTCRRDELKRKKCKKMKVQLIYIRDGYVLEQVLQQIRDTAVKDIPWICD